ncbi:MAG TPA: response regulator [Gemmataceae bacterium]|nr:response regulator [Gemmataceae bacterium]
MADQPRFLVLGDTGSTGADWLRRCGLEGDCIHADSWDAGLEQLRRLSLDAIVANPADPAVLRGLRALVQSQHILAALPDGVAVVDANLRVRLANPTFEAWCGGDTVGRGFYEVLGAAPDIVGPDLCPFHVALGGTGVSPVQRTEDRRDAGPTQRALPACTTTRLHCRGDRAVDLHITPISEPDSPTPLLLALGRDVTALVQQQQKLDALHKAGRELAALSADQLADMSVAERIELLKLNIRRFTRDLLRYEVIEIRLLDPQTGRLEPLVQEGMIPLAANRVLLASSDGQGVTGRVAATGKSYLCPDTTADPLYLPGAPGAHSSLTVPLFFQDKVIGTFNVESPKPNAFGGADLQFAEIFSHEIAAALHTLELLQVEKSTSASQSVEAISREVALPVDDILASATSILERYIGHDSEMADKIRKIIVGARAIKQCIQKVGEDMAGSPDRRDAGPTGKPPPPALKGLRVLVADNDDRVRRSAHGLLGRWGCIVETARDGQEALTMARLSTYDAILADIRLPDISGYEVYHRLRQAQPHSRVILMTGYGYDPTHALVKARQDGLRFVLFKPFRVDQLRDALAKPAEPPESARHSPSSDRT